MSDTHTNEHDTTTGTSEAIWMPEWLIRTRAANKYGHGQDEATIKLIDAYVEGFRAGVLDERREQQAMHEAYRPEVVAEIAVHLSDETDWDVVAEWCGGTIENASMPEGECYSTLVIPNVGVAWNGSWIVQRHDLTFAIRASVAGPSERSVAALTHAAEAPDA